MILINAVAPVAEIGGKAYHLLSMGIKNTPLDRDAPGMI